MEANPTYADGLRDGRILAVEDMQVTQNNRLTSHSGRITVLERVAWILAGATAVIQFAPAIRSFLGIS